MFWPEGNKHTDAGKRFLTEFIGDAIGKDFVDAEGERDINEDGHGGILPGRG